MMIIEKDSVGSEPSENDETDHSALNESSTVRPDINVGVEYVHDPSKLHQDETLISDDTTQSPASQIEVGIHLEEEKPLPFNPNSFSIQNEKNPYGIQQQKNGAASLLSEVSSQTNLLMMQNELKDSAPRVSSAFNSSKAEENVDEYITSPRGRNAIVERSPGGRYVRFIEKLGSGASKDVYRAYDTTEGIEVAWNVVQLSGVPKSDRNRIVNEVRLLERLHHPNIISFHGSWVNRERQEVNFVTEILSSGTLTSFIEKVQVIRWKIAKRWAIQILKGLEYLHSQDPPVIHRDLKCANIFINGTSGDLRIGDLGLSTVHCNGKVLSVLGTPEFMAPDLYEECAYDEKIDVYAFGMCLLEILTKEIPYKECSNPAQIYRKVMNGEKPESLSRLRSKKARDFIILCLGEKDSTTGRYSRPSVKELLTNPFLGISPDDDSEVIVDPPLLSRIIEEHPTVLDHELSIPLSLRAKQHAILQPLNRDSLDDDSSDDFGDMPNSEKNIRRVKVMMGRNEELHEIRDIVKSDPVSVLTHNEDVKDTIPVLSSDSRGPELNPRNVHSVKGSLDDSIPKATPSQLIFAATVIEDQAAAMPHYQDELLKLIITLPVQGQTQNVQFDFHLLEDDPVAVAKEMVAELGIPQDAVLEISGTISALARQARIKQSNFRRNQQGLTLSAQGNVPSQIPVVLIPESQALASLYSTNNAAHILKPLPLQSTAQGQLSNSVSIATQPPLQRQTNQSNPQVGVSQGVSQSSVLKTLASSQNPTAAPPPPVDLLLLPINPPNQISKNSSPLTQNLTRKQSGSVELQPSTFDTTTKHITHDDEKSGTKIIDLTSVFAKNKELHDDDDSLTEELRRLDEDFQKNIVRAQKVFDSRMDNLQRSKQEKEALHKKTLQKHEKEKIEFEKRLQQEEIEQNQRLEKIQREWETQRQLLEMSKRGKIALTADSTTIGVISKSQINGSHMISKSPSQESLIQLSGNPKASTK
jgi:WNK lysine deficient protein kinase